MTEPDPFAEGGKKTPALSWKGSTAGTKYVLRIDEYAKKLQGRDFDTEQPLFWDEAKTQPVMCAVLNVTVESGYRNVGEERSVWATMPSAIFAAIRDAQKEFGRQLRPGDRLEIEHYGDEDKGAKKNPRKLYRAKCIEGVQPPPAGSDAFASAGSTNTDDPPF